MSENDAPKALGIRIAIRDHGEYVHFSLAGATMENAKLLMMVHKSILTDKVYGEVKDILVNFVSEIATGVGLTMTHWRDRPAPGSEQVN